MEEKAEAREREAAALSSVELTCLSARCPGSAVHHLTVLVNVSALMRVCFSQCLFLFHPNAYPYSTAVPN